MHGTFFWDIKMGTFFFKNLQINTAGSFALVCAILFIAAICYEALKVHSAQVRARTARERERSASCAPSETATLISSDTNAMMQQSLWKRFRKMFFEAFVFLIHGIIGYALMLAVMLYNGYVFIVVVMGMGLGYFIFGYISMKINMENMQARTTNAICSPKFQEEQNAHSSCQSSVHGSIKHIGESSGSSIRRTYEQNSTDECSSSSAVTDSCHL